MMNSNGKMPFTGDKTRSTATKTKIPKVSPQDNSKVILVDPSWKLTLPEAKKDYPDGKEVIVVNKNVAETTPPPSLGYAAAGSWEDRVKQAVDSHLAHALRNMATKEEFEKMVSKEEFDALHTSHVKLQSDKEALKRAMSTMVTKKEFDTLQSAHDKLREDHDELDDGHKKLQLAHNELSDKHHVLEAKFACAEKQIKADFLARGIPYNEATLYEDALSVTQPLLPTSQGANRGTAFPSYGAFNGSGDSNIDNNRNQEN